MAISLFEDFSTLRDGGMREDAFSAFYRGISTRKLNPLDVADITDIAESVRLNLNDQHSLGLRIALGENLLAAPRFPLTPKTLVRALPSVNAIADAFVLYGREDEADQIIYRALDSLVHLRGSRGAISRSQAREWQEQAQAASPEYHGRFAITSPQHPYPHMPPS